MRTHPPTLAMAQIIRASKLMGMSSARTRFVKSPCAYPRGWISSVAASPRQLGPQAVCAGGLKFRLNRHERPLVRPERFWLSLMVHLLGCSVRLPCNG